MESSNAMTLPESAMDPDGQDLEANNNQQNDSDNRIKKSNDPKAATLIGKVFLIISYILVVGTFPFSLFLCIKIVQEFERAVVFRSGKLIGGGAKGPGLFFILPCIDDYSVVDLRTITYDVAPQEILTKDSLTVTVDAVLFYRIWLPTIAVSNVYDYSQATHLLTASTIRNVLGTRTLTEILRDRKQLSLDMCKMVDSATKAWGVEIERIEIKNVCLPVGLQRSMAIEAETMRTARAKIILSQGELRSSSGLTEAAKIMSEEPMALQLRYLQNLSSNSSDKETTILFPIPIPMLTIKL